MKKVWMGVTVFLLAELLLFAAWERKGKEEGEMPVLYQDLPQIHLMVASDLHYLSPSLTDHGGYFTEMVRHSDGKVMEYSEELAEAFVDTVIKNKPDVLILTGDLTFNGARKSHEDLAVKLAEIESAGIPVLVISGNHDLDNRYAASFSGDGYELVPGVSPAGFEELYAAFGYEDAVSRDQASSSYVWEPAAGLRLLMLDVNGVEEPGSVPEETLRWLEQQLDEARESGSRVLSFSHQNLLEHSMFEEGYVIGNSDEVLRLYREYGVAVNFTGHLHIQHIGEEDGFCEIATSALSVSPNQYADIMLESSGLEYSTSSVDVSAWAAQHRPDSAELLDFERYAGDFFWDTSYGQAAAELRDMEDEGLKDAMAGYFAGLNQIYFSGHMEKAVSEEGLLEEWRHSGTLTGRYLESILENAHEDQNHMVLELP